MRSRAYGIFIVALVFLSLASCSATTTIKDPDGRVYEIVSQKDALVKADLNNGVSLIIDNRGSRSTIQTALDMWILRWMTTDEEGK